MAFTLGGPQMRTSIEAHLVLGSTSHVEHQYQRATFRGDRCTVVGGYQYTFLHHDHERFVCIICKNVAKDIHQVTCCGKHLCRECLDRCRLQSELCPHCRNPDLKNYIFPDTSANQRVLSLMINCPNRSNGCSWQGEVREADAHLRNRCECLFVKCDCGQDVLKREQKHHMFQVCGLRWSNCPDCNEQGKYRWLTTEHEAACLGKVIDCPNEGCGEKVKRCEIAEHQKKCAKEKVRCQHHELLGCKELMSRENLTAHEQERLRRHLQMAEARIKQLEVHHKEEVQYSKAERVPQVFQIESFHSQFEQKIVWESKGFYSDCLGYKMCLKVHLNGSGCGTDTHISYFLHLMPGVYDEDLPWPFEGKVVVEVLNQLENGKHSTHEKQFLAHQEMEYNKRVCGKRMNEIGLGEPRFFPHRDLVPKPESNINYVKDGSLYIRVQKIEVYSVPQAWLRPAHC